MVGKIISVIQASKQHRKVKKYTQIIKLCKWQNQNLKLPVWLQIPFLRPNVYTVLFILRVSWYKLVLWTIAFLPMLVRGDSSLSSYQKKKTKKKHNSLKRAFRNFQETLSLTEEEGPPDLFSAEVGMG